VIKRLISAEKKEWIVVSSDRDIVSYSWSHGSVPVPSSEFYSILERAAESFLGEYELLDDEDGHVIVRKGNPRKPSKREKALIRVIRKL
jgi:hypothetical protein